MKKPTLYTIAKALENSPYPFFTKPYSVNLGGIRDVDNLESNAFNDLIYAIYTNSDGELRGVVVNATTDAGLYYRENPLNVKGTAILIPGCYRSVYQLKDNGHKGYRAFRQVKNMDYYRDADRDGELEMVGGVSSEIALTNLHHAGQNSTQVDKWSAGCQVVGSMKDWDKLLEVGETQIRNGLGDKFSYTLFHSDEFDRLTL